MGDAQKSSSHLNETTTDSENGWARIVYSETLTRGTGCLNWARPGLWGLRVGNCPVLPGSLRFKKAQKRSLLRRGTPHVFAPALTRTANSVSLDNCGQKSSKTGFYGILEFSISPRSYAGNFKCPVRCIEPKVRPHSYPLHNRDCRVSTPQLARLTLLAVRVSAVAKTYGILRRSI
jgi:hypothetical protein